MGPYFRGGNSLKIKPGEIRINRVSGLVKPTRGLSVFNRPDNLDRFGGAYELIDVPPELSIIQVGRDPSHFEIAPAQPMTLRDYEEALSKIKLVRVQ